MTQVGLKSLLIAIGIIAVLLFATGLVQMKPDGYACAGGWDTGFRDRVQLVHYGPVHIYGYPFTRECAEDRRYDPNDVQSCVDTGFCSIKEAEDR